jgi:hypothetical protein
MLRRKKKIGKLLGILLICYHTSLPSGSPELTSSIFLRKKKKEDSEDLTFLSLMP